MLRLALRSIRTGERPRDKAVIAAHWGALALFPLGMAARKIGAPLPDPRAALGEYEVRGSAGVFTCPPGPVPFFLSLDPAHEPGLFALIDRLQGGVFVDCGASVGFVTVRAARRAERVIAIEPHPVRFAYLERNVARNGLTNVKCFNCALGSASGTVAIYDVDPTLGPHPLDVSSTPGRGRRFDVPLRRLDDLVEEPVSVLKVDVEGAEVEVLGGAEEVLRSQPVVFVESLAMATRNELQGALHGYSLRPLDSNNLLASPAS